MHDFADFESWVQLTGGLLVVLLGAFMLTVRPRLRGNVAFAVFAVSFGSGFIASNAGWMIFHDPTTGGSVPLALVRAFLYVSALASLIWIARVFPTPLGEREVSSLVIPTIGGLFGLAIVGVYFVSAPRDFITMPHALIAVTWFVFVGTLSGLPAMFALRSARTSDPMVKRQFLLISSALILYSGFIATAGAGAEPAGSILDPVIAWWLYPNLGFTLLAAALWLRETTGGETSRAARNGALLCVAMPFLGIVYVAFDPKWGALGIARTAMVILLAYGIARHQLLGIDVKLRWTISKSTLAAMFITVFFIASEGAQQFFGDTLGSTYVGIAVAGMLVFAIAPLHRVAERLAERAVPIGDSEKVSPARTGSAAEAYRHGVRAAMRDGVLTRREERHLAELARALGIDSVEALELREEVEGESAGSLSRVKSS